MAAFTMPIVAPDGGLDYTIVRGMSDSGLFCGFSEGRDIDFHGFVWSGDTFTDFDVSGAVDTFLLGMNDAGDLCGYTQNPSAGFVSIAETVTSFTVPRAVGTYPNAINNRDQCVGSYDTGAQIHGFLRDAGGTLVYPVDAPGATHTFLNGINDQGAMVGEALGNTGIHGAFFRSVNKAALFDCHGASVTVFTGINNRGLICGFYQTATNMRSRAFLVRVRPAAQN